MNLITAKQKAKDLGLSSITNPLKFKGGKRFAEISIIEAVKLASALFQHGIACTGAAYNGNMVIMNNDETYFLVYSEPNGLAMTGKLTKEEFQSFIPLMKGGECAIVYETDNNSYCIAYKN